MKKTFVLPLILLLIAVFGNYGMAQTDQPNKKGYEDYIEYLKVNRDVLKYNTYGMIETDEEIVIKIYCDRESQLQVLNGLGGFNYRTYETKEFSENQIVISIFFPRDLKTEPVPLEEKEGEAVKLEPETPVATASTAPEEINAEAREEQGEIKCPRRVKVQVRPVTPQVFREYRHYKKTLVYDRDVELRTRISAQVKEVSVGQGDRVQEGQLLVRLDSAAIEREIAGIQELLKNWKEILFKRRNWKERSPRAEKQAEEKVAEAEVLLAEKMDELSQTMIKAPFEGQVVSIVSQGESLEQGAIVARMVTDHRMKVVIDPSDCHLFGAGAEVDVFPSGYDTGITGTVVVNPEETKILLPDENRRLVPGMEVKFRILDEIHSQALVVLEQQVFKDDGGHYAFVVDGKRAARRNIQVASVEEGKVLIESGLSVGDEVIISGFECLKEGKKIKVMVWDEELGKLRARKKKEAIPAREVEPEEEVKIPEIPVEPVEKKKNYWRLSGGLGIFTNTGSVFTDVYGAFVPSGFLTASFVIREKFEVFFSTAYTSWKGASSGLEEDVTLTMFPFYIGGKIYLNKIKKFSPFVGAAMARYNTKESFAAGNEFHADTNWRSNFGGSIFAGVYWPLSSKLDLMASLHYDISKVPIDDTDESVDLSGFRLFIGISYPLGRD